MKGKSHTTPETSGNDRWEYFRNKAEEQKMTSRKLQNVSDEEKERIFLERAQNLSRAKGKTTEDQDLVKIISFHVAGEFFGIEVKYLQEVYEVTQITQIPCTQEVLVGLINYRGTVLTIIDLRLLFNLNGEERDTQIAFGHAEDQPIIGLAEKILIVEYLDAKAGIIIDKLDNLLEIPKAAIQPVSSFFQAKNSIVKSEVQFNELPLLLIDPKALLNDERLVVNEDV